MSPSTRLLAASLLGLASALTGCQQAGEAATRAAQATAAGANQAAAAAKAAFGATELVVLDLLPWVEEPQAGPESYRQELLDRAGPEHFANPAFLDAREALQGSATAFPDLRTHTRVERFEQMRDQFRGGPGVPQRGRVVGEGEPIVVTVNGKPVVVRLPAGLSLERALPLITGGVLGE